MSSPNAAVTWYQTQPEVISENAFYGVLWLGVGLCAISFCLRSYVRFIYFRMLLVDDYLMLTALILLIAIASVLQVWLQDIYLMIRVQNGLAIPGADFFDRMSSGLRADGIAILLFIIGVWIIKLNFLLFFYRLGHQITQYLIFWWVALVIVVGCGAAGVGVIPYDCMFGDIMHIITQCSSESSVGHIYDVYKASVVVDVCSDAIIICFPIIILWNTRISIKQKLILSSVFCLVSFTIAVTIIRGSIFGGLYKSLDQVDRKVFDTTWVLFWFFIQYIVSFIVACLVSFRSLWARRREQRSRDEFDKQRLADHRSPGQTPSAQSGSLKAKLKKIQDTLLDTFNDFDDETLKSRDEFIKLRPPQARMTIDFSQGVYPWSSTHTTSKTQVESQETTRADTESVQSLNPAHLRDAGSQV
ncbi:hypothetical protein QBC46DRAFT_423853 [Diplogelasinospora grovesii]|uniref:Rhodopsin domain-containing protein n=1 Tax=Diplogelasinospora grovesii TaxID=303347 RepID=A0AAN6NBQ9_9PEZI|nr:hypothetical protein QBC46DRAFT_423853 [Diplogelasinospora grovesii]